MKKRAVSSGAVSNPGLALCRLRKLRTNSDAPTSRISAIATSSDDQTVAQPRALAALSGSAGAVAQRFLQIQAAGLQRRREAEDEAGQRGDRDRVGDARAR